MQASRIGQSKWLLHTPFRLQLRSLYSPASSRRPQTSKIHISGNDDGFGKNSKSSTYDTPTRDILAEYDAEREGAGGRAALSPRLAKETEEEGGHGQRHKGSLPGQLWRDAEDRGDEPTLSYKHFTPNLPGKEQKYARVLTDETAGDAKLGRLGEPSVHGENSVEGSKKTLKDVQERVPPKNKIRKILRNPPQNYLVRYTYSGPWPDHFGGRTAQHTHSNPSNKKRRGAYDRDELKSPERPHSSFLPDQSQETTRFQQERSSFSRDNLRDTGHDQRSGLAIQELGKRGTIEETGENSPSQPSFITNYSPNNAVQRSPTRKSEEQGQVQEGAPKTGASENGGQLSLLEELFPEEVKRAKRSRILDEAQARRALEIESHYRLPLVPDAEYGAELGLFNDVSSKKADRDDVSLDMLGYKNLTVLVLYGGSPNLVEADFWHIVHHGAHIDGWRGEGGFIKVIADRNPSTLTPNNRYYLLFPNATQAHAYKERAYFMHRTAKKFMPVSMTSPPPPAPGAEQTGDGQDVAELLREWSLSSPGHPLYLRALFPPFPASLRRILIAEAGGHGEGDSDGTDVDSGRAAATAERYGRSVIFWIDGYQASTPEVVQFLGRDRWERGCKWTPVNDPADSVREMPRKSIKKGGYPRWIISFCDESEARRFVRIWHRRSFVPLKGWTQVGEPEPQIHAEFLW